MSKPNVNSDWFVYMLRCADKSLYTGVTINLDKRLAEHNHDNRKAANYTRVRRPVCLVYHEIHKTRSEACIREAEIKKYSKQAKEDLVLTSSQ